MVNAIKIVEALDNYLGQRVQITTTNGVLIADLLIDQPSDKAHYFIANPQGDVTDVAYLGQGEAIPTDIILDVSKAKEVA